MASAQMDLLLWNLQPPPGRKNWHGGPSPVGALRGVTAEQAAWRPTPRRKSIWELALHIAYWKYTVRRHLEHGVRPGFPRRPANFPAQPEPADEAAWSRDVALLRAEHELVVQAVRALSAIGRNAERKDARTADMALVARLVAADIRKQVVGAGVGRVVGQDALHAARRLVELVAAVVRFAQQPERVPVMEMLERGVQVRQHVGVVGLEHERREISVHRLGLPALCDEREAEIVVRRGICGVARERL